MNGLTSDCGGGSVELSYVISGPRGGEHSNTGFQAAQAPVSLPYGAMALKRRLLQCDSKKERQALYEEVKTALRQALHETQPPAQLQQQGKGSSDGYELYMSGGGFRALGYLSMARKSHKIHGSKHKRQPHYPIPMINGYTITGKALKKLVHRYNDKKFDDVVRQVQGFRISKRRAEMMPAVCFLVSAMVEAIPIRRVHFSEGGVRQGICYQMLPACEQVMDPLMTSVKAYVATSDFGLRDEDFEAIYHVLKAALLPGPYLDPAHPLQLFRLLPAAIYLANLTSHYPKESRAYVAFHIPLPSGPLANVPGLTHKERATLAILLAYRQGGAIPDPIFYKVQGIVGKKGIAVCKYLGRLMELVFTVSPLQPGVGLIRSGLKFSTTLTEARDDSDASDLDGNNSMNSEGSDTEDDRNHDDDDDDDEDDEESDTTNSINQYPSLKLRIQLPQETSILLNAPSVMSLMEKLDKKVNTRKFDMDGAEKKIRCPSLFSVDITHGQAE